MMPIMAVRQENNSSANASQQNKDNWHYDFANKMISSWPAWKKEIYDANYSKAKKEKA